MKAVLIDPETGKRVRGKKTKKEKRRIRRQYESGKRTRPAKRSEAKEPPKYSWLRRKR